MHTVTHSHKVTHTHTLAKHPCYSFCLRDLTLARKQCNSFLSDRVRGAISPLPILSLHSSVLWDACDLFTLLNGTTQHQQRQRGWKGTVKVSVAPCQEVKGKGRKASKPPTGSAVTIESAACLSPSITYANVRSSKRRAAPTIELTAWLAKPAPSIDLIQLHNSCTRSLKPGTAKL